MHSAVYMPMPPTAYDVAPSQEDRILDSYLEEWAKYAEAPDGSMGFPRRSGPFSSGGYSKSSDEMEQESVNLPRCKLIQTIVFEDLPPVQAAAVKHRYGLAVFRFPRDNYAQALLAARMYIAITLRKRNLWGVFA